jgi:hypothetical protein
MKRRLKNGAYFYSCERKRGCGKTTVALNLSVCFAKDVYYQLHLLSYGFHRDTCIVGCSKLAKSLIMSKRKLQETIVYLEKRGLIKRLRSILGGPAKGNVYRVFLPATGDASGATDAPNATLAPHTTVARYAPNKYDDDIKIKSSAKSAILRSAAPIIP